MNYSLGQIYEILIKNKLGRMSDDQFVSQSCKIGITPSGYRLWIEGDNEYFYQEILSRITNIFNNAENVVIHEKIVNPTYIGSYQVY